MGLANRYIVSGLLISGSVPSIIFLISVFFETSDVAIPYYFVFAIQSLFPGFLGISLPCWTLLWRRKISLLWHTLVPPITVLLVVLIFDPYGGGLNFVPVFFAIAVAVAAFAGYMFWIVSIRLNPLFKTD